MERTRTSKSDIVNGLSDPNSSCEESMKMPPTMTAAATTTTTTTTIGVDEEPVPSSGIIPLPHPASAADPSTNNSGLPTPTTPPPKKQREQIKNFFVQNVRYEHLVAGVSGGVVSTLVCHPLDLIKVRFQVYEGHALANPKVSRPQYRGLLHAGLTIAKADGLSGLYAGIVPNIVGGGAAWGLYFLFYNAAKNFIRGDADRPLSWKENMVCACQSGVVTLGLTNPIWVTKTRLCLQYERLRLKKLGQLPASSSSSSSSSSYSGMTNALGQIYRQEGVRGLYRGFVPGLFGVSHGVLQFMAYEEMKKHYNRYRGAAHDARFSTAEYLIFAALSKCFAAVSTYPYQVMRTRLQDQHRQYRGLTEVVVCLWKYEGVKGFYKGLVPSLMRVVPATMITFLTYENVSHALLTYYGKNKST